MRSVLAAACAAWLLGAGLAAAAPQKPEETLERVVLVMRHGVRPPTSSPEKLRPLSAQPWPSWPVAPGELTDHGADVVRLMGAGLRARYMARGLLPAAACPAEGTVSVWADRADQRTRKSGEALAQALAPRCGLAAPHGPEGETDALFDALKAGVCRLDPDEARRAVAAQAGGQEIATPATRRALSALQAVVAPQACMGGPGACLSGADVVTADRSGVKLEGPLATGSTLAENLLLEYEEGFAPAQVGWGRASPAVLEVVTAAHERFAELTRRTPYVAAGKGATMAAAILDALDGEPSSGLAGPTVGPGTRLVAFAGHDTNLSNMAGIFGLTWSLPGQPDATAPATTLAFELWRDGKGRRYVRPVVLYERLDQIRRLKPAAVSQVPLRFEGCSDGPKGSCSVAGLRRRVAARPHPDCD